VGQVPGVEQVIPRPPLDALEAETFHLRQSRNVLKTDIPKRPLSFCEVFILLPLLHDGIEVPCTRVQETKQRFCPPLRGVYLGDRVASPPSMFTGDLPPRAGDPMKSLLEHFSSLEENT